MPKSKDAPDAIALLKADHRKVEELFDKFENARGRKAQIVEEICKELTIHTVIEEEIFYPACQGAVEEDVLDEALVEHDGAKLMIAELQAGKVGEDFFDAKVKVLSEEIKHHVKEEEKRDGVFAQIRKSDLDLGGLGEKLQARKEELQAQIERSGVPMPITRTLRGGKVEHGRPAA